MEIFEALLEVQRVVNSMFIIWDQDLAAEDPAMVNCSDLNEELGQVSCHWLISGHVTTVTLSHWPDQSPVHGQDGDADRERDGVQGGLHRGPDVLRGRAAGAEAAALLLRRRGRHRARRGRGVRHRCKDLREAGEEDPPVPDGAVPLPLCAGKYKISKTINSETIKSSVVALITPFEGCLEGGH